MASVQASDDHSNVQISPDSSATPGNAQEGNEGSSRTRYSRKAKKESDSVGKGAEAKDDAKEIPKIRGKSKSKKAKIDAQAGVEEKKEDLVTGLNLPLDIWILIAEQVDPVSLLQLTRINKTLRSLLTSKRTSKAIWKKHIDRLGLPKLKSDDGKYIAFISFVYEKICAHCGAKGAELRDWNHRVQCHQACIDELFKHMSRTDFNKEGIQFGSALSAGAGWYALYYLRSDIASLSREFKAVPSERQRKALVSSCKESVKLRSDDGETLDLWFTNAISSRNAKIGTTADPQDVDTIAEELGLVPVTLTDIEWSSVSTRFVQAVTALKIDREQRQRRQTLTPRYHTLRNEHTSQSSDIFPSLHTFLELPSVKGLWEPTSTATKQGGWAVDGGRLMSSIIENLEKKWTDSLPSIKLDIHKTIRWYKLGYVRIMAQALNEAGQPLSSSLTTSINPPGSITPAFHEEIKPSDINVNDPSTISNKALNDILQQYSTQAWHQEGGNIREYKDQMAGEYLSRFPRFSVYWYNVLLQSLEVADFSDGPLETTSKRLDKLGANFSCGLCETSNKRFRLSTLLRHLQTHPIPTSNRPSKQLIIYKDPNAPSPSAPQASSSAAPQATASSTQKSVSKGKE